MFYKHVIKYSINCISNHSGKRIIRAFLDKSHRNHFLHKRSFSNSSLKLCATASNDDLSLAESYSYDVQQFGKITVRSAMAVHIEPLNPLNFPDMKNVLVRILQKKDASETNGAHNNNFSKHYTVDVDLEQLPEEFIINVSTREDARKLPFICQLQIPIKYDVDLTCEKNGSSTLTKLESSFVKVRTSKGNCTCKSIKSGKVKISTMGGSIKSESVMQGNLKLHTRGEGTVEADRLQGQTVDVRTDAGEVTVKAVYADKSTFRSHEGNISLLSCHGNSDINTDSGDLSVGSLDGSLTASLKSGSANVCVSREGTLQLTTETGNAALQLPQAMNSSVSLTAKSVDPGTVNIHKLESSKHGDKTHIQGHLSSHVADHTSGSVEVVAEEGQITLGHQDWFSSLNLGKLSD